MTDSDSMFAPLTDHEVAAVPVLGPARPDRRPILPAPDDAPPMECSHPVHGEPSQTWAYHDAMGRVVCYVCRWNFTDDEGKPDKDVRPVTYREVIDGVGVWCLGGVPAPRPLLGLPDILSNPDVPILVTEGEVARLLLCWSSSAVISARMGRLWTSSFVD